MKRAELLTCQSCGLAVEVRRIALLVEGRIALELRLCARCLSDASDSLRQKAAL